MELRTVVIVEADRYDEVVAFYRGLGLEVAETFDGGGGRGTLLDAGRATLEILDEPHAAWVDDLEVGSPQQLEHRLALRVDSVEAAAAELDTSVLLGGPVPMPWGGVNARLQPPGGAQLTLFDAT